MTVELLVAQFINGVAAPVGSSVTLSAAQEAALLASGAAIQTNVPLPPPAVQSPTSGLIAASQILAARRAANIASFLQGAAVAAPAWAATTAYSKGQSVTLPTGQVILCVTAGTSGGSVPVYSKTVLHGRPITDGTVTWYGCYIQNGAASLAAPTVSLNANAAAAGLTFSALNSGGVSPLVTCFGGIPSNAGGGSSIFPFTFASGTTGGNSTGAATALGYSASYGYSSFDFTLEFYITDSVVGLVFTGNTNPQVVEIDGVLMTGSPTVCTNVAGQCIVFDFNGIVKRRQVRISFWTGTANGVMTGVALSSIGFVEVTDSPNDQMLLLGDSIFNSISGPGSVAPISTVAALLKRYLGLAGVLNCSVGGSGYVAFNANTFNVGAVLANPVNQTLFAGYNPPHVLIAAGYNDTASSTPTAVAAAALAAWQAARTLLPTAKITITDGFSQAKGPDANSLAQAVALQAQYTAWGDPNSRFIQSISASAATAWMQGTANAGSALATGNTCVYVGTDTTHPTLLGADYQARRLANAVKAAWNNAY